MKRISRDSTTKQVVDVFQSDLKAGRLKIGDKLPSEVELAKMLGIGRSSLREALRVLSVYGIVEARHGEGTFIVDNRAAEISRDTNLPCFSRQKDWSGLEKTIREPYRISLNINWQEIEKWKQAIRHYIANV